MNSQDLSSDIAPYDALRNKVVQLRVQQQQQLKQQQAVREVDLAALAEQRAHYATQLEELQQHNAKLQQQLKQNVDRSAKLRQQAEREKKALTGQVERLTKVLESIDQKHAEELVRVESQCAAQVEQLKADMAALQEAHEAQRREVEESRDAAIKDVDEWCQGEIEAVQHNARLQVTQAHDCIQEWQAKYDAEVGRHRLTEDRCSQLADELQETSCELHECQQQLESARAEAAKCREQRAEADGAWQLQLDRLQEEQQHKLEAQKRLHRQQLDGIKARMQGVVSKKDAAIASLKAELQEHCARWTQMQHAARGVLS